MTTVAEHGQYIVRTHSEKIPKI